MKYYKSGWEFELYELEYLMFGNKKCPRCLGKLTKTRHQKLAKGVYGVVFNKYYNIYTCPTCQKQYTLDELASEWGFKGDK